MHIFGPRFRLFVVRRCLPAMTNGAQAMATKVYEGEFEGQ